MKKYLIVSGLILLGICFKGDAQNDTSSPQQLRQLLNMTEVQYSPFADSLTSYSIQQGAIQNDNTKTMAEQRTLLLGLWAARRSFILSSLTPAQRTILEQYEISRSNISPRRRLLEEQEERMRQRGLHVIGN